MFLIICVVFDHDHILRSPEQVTQRLDRLIQEIRKLQEPYIKDGGAGDVLLVKDSFHPPRRSCLYPHSVC